MKEHGPTLVMDLNTGAGKMGDYGKILLFLPEVWMHGSPENASVKTACFMLFMAGLLSLFLSFWMSGYRLLGGLLVLFVGSDPFQVFQVYRNSNVFSISISVALLVCALNLRLLLPNVGNRRWHFAAAVVSGALLAWAKGIRVEAGFMIYALIPLYFVLDGVRLQRRAFLVGSLLAAYLLTNQVHAFIFDALYSRAVSFISQHGGTPYEGPRRHHHVVWHTLATGLGDFGQKYGYAWDDRTIFALGVPKVIERYHPDYRFEEGGFVFKNSHDAKGVYPIQPEDLPEYETVLREKILSDIWNDPVWYAGVLARRAWRILSELTPVSVALGKYRIGVPVHGLVILILLGFLIRRRDWFEVKLVLFTLPLCLGPLLHYSGGGLTYFALYHVFGAALIIAKITTLNHRVKWVEPR